MTFKLVNSVDPKLEGENVKLEGISSQNVNRRLQLLYKDNHHIETFKLKEVYIVNLEHTLEILEEEFVDQLQFT